MRISNVERALMLANSFEAEVFIQLLLGKWSHPLAEDPDFQNDLLEAVTLVIQAAMDGETHIEALKPQDFNFVAAVWFAEWSTLQSTVGEIPFREERQRWLADVKHSLPSCFCDPADLL